MDPPTACGLGRVLISGSILMGVGEVFGGRVIASVTSEAPRNRHGLDVIKLAVLEYN